MRRARDFAFDIAFGPKTAGTEQYGESFSYEFATWVTLPARILIGDPLVVLGGGHVSAWVVLSADWKGGDIWSWTVGISYHIDDEFTDPLDIWDRTPDTVENWAYCEPYAIIGEWYWQASGAVSIATGQTFWPGR